MYCIVKSFTSLDILLFMKKEEYFVVLIILTVLGYGVYLYSNKAKESKNKKHLSVVSRKIDYTDKNLTQDGIIDYIENVINNGSNHLHFQKGGMEGGYVPKSKARDVAYYVYELSGKKANKPYAKDASLYFSSNCAGCHGIDGKGIKGSFPDLTRIGNRETH